MPQPDPNRRPPKLALAWLGYVPLFALSIPWYLPADVLPPVWLGLPHWVVISLVVCFLVGVYTVWLIRRCWPDDEEGP